MSSLQMLALACYLNIKSTVCYFVSEAKPVLTRTFSDD